MYDKDFRASLLPPKSFGGQTKLWGNSFCSKFSKPPQTEQPEHAFKRHPLLSLARAALGPRWHTYKQNRIKNMKAVFERVLEKCGEGLNPLESLTPLEAAFLSNVASAWNEPGLKKTVDTRAQLTGSLLGVAQASLMEASEIQWWPSHETKEKSIQNLCEYFQAARRQADLAPAAERPWEKRLTTSETVARMNELTSPGVDGCGHLVEYGDWERMARWAAASELLRIRDVDPAKEPAVVAEVVADVVPALPPALEQESGGAVEEEHAGGINHSGVEEEPAARRTEEEAAAPEEHSGEEPSPRPPPNDFSEVDSAFPPRWWRAALPSLGEGDASPEHLVEELRHVSFTSLPAFRG